MQNYDNQNPLFGNTFLNTKWFNPDFWFHNFVNFFHDLSNFISTSHTQISGVFHILEFFLAVFFLTVIAYTSVRMFEIRKKEHAHLHHEMHEYAHHQAEKEAKSKETEAVSKNQRWIQVLAYLFSQHASDWKLAIIEADSMLEQLLDQLGFIGATLGDKLKNADPEKFQHLTSAWEVHTIRNKIAHDGVAFDVTQREAKRVIAIYEDIFRGYGFI